jgi:hypothetical protein
MQTYKKKQTYHAMLSWRKLSGDPPETLLRGSSGSPDIMAKSLANPDKILDFFFKFFFENFVWICQ